MNRVTHFEVQADDIERAKKFYQETFGWKIENWMSAAKGDPMDYWGLVSGEPDKGPGINGGLYQRPPDNKLYTFDCTIQVDDIDKAIEAVKKNGGIITREKMELKNIGWFASCKDTEGNRFALMQSTNKKGV
ncbi:MAG: VOC family protein [Candidatus Falkowbacteria bacterium]